MEIPTDTLESLGLTFIDLVDGYLIVENHEGEYELWHWIDEEGALMHIEEQGSEGTPILEYDVDLYSWVTTESDIEEIKRQIRHELEK